MSSNQLGRATDDQWLDFVAFTACEKSRFSLKRRSVFQTGAKIYVAKKYIFWGQVHFKDLAACTWYGVILG